VRRDRLPVRREVEGLEAQDLARLRGRDDRVHDDEGPSSRHELQQLEGVGEHDGRPTRRAEVLGDDGSDAVVACKWLPEAYDRRAHSTRSILSVRKWVEHEMQGS
jgi:hypothetical protein